MAGNTNTYVAEKRELDPVLIARKLRFFPYSHHRRTVCMRVEIYGCPWYVDWIPYVILVWMIFDSCCYRPTLKGRKGLPVIRCLRETSAGPAGNSTTPLTTASGTALCYARVLANWLTENSVPTTSKPATTTRIEVKIRRQVPVYLPGPFHQSVLMLFFLFYDRPSRLGRMA